MNELFESQKEKTKTFLTISSSDTSFVYILIILTVKTHAFIHQYFRYTEYSVIFSFLNFYSLIFSELTIFELMSCCLFL